MLQVRDVPAQAITGLLSRFGLTLVIETPAAAITGSFWGDSEAGIVAYDVFVCPDTPIHSLLHETSHTICIDGPRRAGLNRDAGGDDLEEAAVCYLQVLLADFLPGVGRERLMRDMDAWGYSFRLGNTALWFASDADDAASWLRVQGLIDADGVPTFTLRPGSR
ncbi:MAG: hypothetical protein O2907_04105 [Proteobacteria bacterium]|nr:hypothetical protein [Pseudomonadota bacterium]MDA1063512.1 hypothetical protein [Pseudomonadota bacterium]